MPEQKLIQRQTALSGNIVQLCRFLRQKGFALSATEEADALSAIYLLPIGKEKYFKKALKIVLCKNQYQYQKYDDLYEEFWDQLAKAVDAKTKQLPDEKDKPADSKKKAAQFEALKNWLNLTPAEEEKEVAAFSDLEVLTRKNFSDLSEEELKLMMRLLQHLARKIAHRKSRLTKISKKKKTLDLKRTISANLRAGPEIQRFIYNKRKERKLKLVLLCDVSKSMDLYSCFFVHLIYAFQNAYDKIETFVFSTALHRVSELLDNHAFDKAFDMISDRVPQWSGGTTIGTCLSDFTHDYGYSMLDKKTIVLILSDGWDTGNAEIMRDAMKNIYKNSRKVIWLNPLAGSENFSPDAMGMKTALPYIDVLASAHNLESLQQAVKQLQKRRQLKSLLGGGKVQ